MVTRPSVGKWALDKGVGSWTWDAPRGSGPALGSVDGEVGGTDDAGLVAQLRRHDGAAERELGQELLAVLGDAATDDDEVGREQLLDGVVVDLQPLDVLASRTGSSISLAEDAARSSAS